LGGAVFDRDDLLERVGHDRALARELVETFLASSPELVARIREALAAGDTTQIERSAHALGGALAGISARPGAEAASGLERLARAGNLDACRSATRLVGAELDRLEPELRGFVGGTP